MKYRPSKEVSKLKLLAESKNNKTKSVKQEEHILDRILVKFWTPILSIFPNLFHVLLFAMLIIDNSRIKLYHDHEKKAEEWIS